MQQRNSKDIKKLYLIVFLLLITYIYLVIS